MPFSACSVPACTRSSSSPAGKAASTAAARRKACTRYVGAPPRSSSNAICRSAWRGSTSGLYPGAGRIERVQVAMLGPLEVRAASGERLEVGGARLRTLLIMLALRPGQLVPARQLIDGLWADRAPSGAPNALQALV